MSEDPLKEIVRYLSEEDLDHLLSKLDNLKIVRRLTLVKNLYKGDDLEEAVDCVSKSVLIGSQ